MDAFGRARLHELLSAVGEHLAAAGHAAGIVVVGGSTLAVRGWVDRTTKDVDVIAQTAVVEGQRSLLPPEPLPHALVQAAARVARDYGLPPDWLNAEIGMQWDFGLPSGILEELEWRQYGGLEVGFAGRTTLLALKLFASVDRGPNSVHFQDLLALTPTDGELEEAAAWVRGQDASRHFPGLVQEVIEHVRRLRDADQKRG